MTTVERSTNFAHAYSIASEMLLQFTISQILAVIFGMHMYSICNRTHTKTCTCNMKYDNINGVLNRKCNEYTVYVYAVYPFRMAWIVKNLRHVHTHTSGLGFKMLNSLIVTMNTHTHIGAEKTDEKQSIKYETYESLI